MTPLGSSSSAAEEDSSMDNTSNITVTTSNTRHHRKYQRHKLQPTTSHHENDYDGELEEGNSGVWANFNSSFRQVQSVLDRNRVLIQQVNENHQSKIPDNMVKNVALIQELNGNISKVVSLYSDLNTNFSGSFHQGNKHGDGRAGKA